MTVHVEPGLTSPRRGGPSESVHTVLLLEQIQAAKPEAQCATCCCFSPSQAEDRKKKSDSIQPSLQWPAVLGHEAMPHARMGSGSSSSPCTPAPQRAVLVQVRYRCPRWGGESVDGSEAEQRIGNLIPFAPGTNDRGLCKAAQRFLVPTRAAKFYVELYLGAADRG